VSGLEAPQGKIFRALASGPMALASKVKVLVMALTAALKNFWHHPQTQGPITTAKIKLKVTIITKAIKI